LETLLPAVVRQSNNTLKSSSVILSGAMSETISSFPVKRSIQMQEKQLSITKTGSTPVFFTSFQKHWNEFPQTKENLFSINYHYEIDGRKIDSLKAGTEVDLVVTITSKKIAEYVMINVPIPAGCSYDENKFTPNYNEVHREYFKNKTSIFCQQLSQGNHTFKIKLQPRFSGKYTINPIKVELMYFPTFYGNSSMSKVKIN
jgi:alpha-2-macroglobulin